MATHSRTLVWKIPWTEESGRLQSMGSQRVRRDWETSLSLLTFMHWRRKWQPTPVFLPGESQGRGSLLGCRLWVAQNRTRLKRLRSSSSRNLTGQKKKKKKISLGTLQAWPLTPCWLCWVSWNVPMAWRHTLSSHSPEFQPRLTG